MKGTLRCAAQPGSARSTWVCPLTSSSVPTPGCSPPSTANTPKISGRWTTWWTSRAKRSAQRVHLRRVRPRPCGVAAACPATARPAPLHILLEVIEGVTAGAPYADQDPPAGQPPEHTTHFEHRVVGDPAALCTLGCDDPPVASDRNERGRDGGYCVPSCVQQRVELRWGGRHSRSEVVSLLGCQEWGLAPPDCTGDQNPTCCCGERMKEASDLRPSTA
jgi:hypothetical protein